MAKLSDEQRRGRVLARHARGCTEAMLLERGFTVVQLGELKFREFAKIRSAGRRVPGEDHRCREEGDRGIGPRRSRCRLSRA
jgi:hypothetical protein